MPNRKRDHLSGLVVLLLHRPAQTAASVGSYEDKVLVTVAF